MDLYTINTTSKQVKEAYAESRIGGRAENQDSYGFSDTPIGFVLTVCDGMGGGPGGKTASSIAVKEIVSSLQEANVEDTVQNSVLKAIRHANLAIIAEAKEKPELMGMGSTCTVLVINEQSATVAYVGDSRVYQLRGRKKVFRTFDHSMVFDLVKQKVITEEQARLSAQSNVITRALGVNEDVKADCFELPFLKGDRFLLTTDGIHGAMPEHELIKLVTDRKVALGVMVDDLATKVDSIGSHSGGYHDNLTLAVVDIKNNSKMEVKMNNRVKMILGAMALVCLLSLWGNVSQWRNRPQAPMTESGSSNLVDSLNTENEMLKDSLNKLQITIDKFNKEKEERGGEQ